MSLEEDIQRRLQVKEVVCKECSERPRAGWKSGCIHLVCACGTRKVPKGVLLSHNWMPDDVEWTVKDQ